MKKYFSLKIVLLFFIFIFSNHMHPQNFVIKKKKAPSISTIKTQCGDSCVQLLQCSCECIESMTEFLCNIPEKNTEILQLIKNLSKLQLLMIHKSLEILENDSTSFFAKADKKKLQEFCDNTSACNQAISSLNKETKETVKIAHEKIQEYMTYMQSL